MQKVGRPRFYVNIIEWLHTLGIIYNPEFYDNLNVYRTLPFQTDNENYAQGSVMYFPPPYNNPFDYPIPFTTEYGGHCFAAALGHKGRSDPVSWHIRIDNPAPDGLLAHETFVPIVNWEGAWSSGIPYDGWSLVTFNGIDMIDADNEKLLITTDYPNRLIIGNFYDMPYPDMKLTQTTSYSQTKEYKTLDGSSVTNNMRGDTAPFWLDLPAWEVHDPYNDSDAMGLYTSPLNSRLSRSGRRSWDMSWSQFADSDLWGFNQMLSTLANDWAVQDPDLEDGDNFEMPSLGYNTNLIEEDSYFTQIWQKTLGGTIPMIMQISRDNPNPDQFAIVRIAQNSLKATRTSLRTYRLQLKLEEVW